MSQCIGEGCKHPSHKNESLKIKAKDLNLNCPMWERKLKELGAGEEHIKGLRDMSRNDRRSAIKQLKILLKSEEAEG